MIIAVGAIIGTAVLRRDHDIAYGLVLVWAYLGITIKQVSASGFDGAYPQVSSTAILGIAALIAAGLVVVATTLGRHRRRPGSSCAPPHVVRDGVDAVADRQHSGSEPPTALRNRSGRVP